MVDKQKGVFGIILAVDELVPLELVSLVKRYLTSQHEAALLLESAPKDMRTKNWKRMKFVEAINYTQFYCQYYLPINVWDCESEKYKTTISVLVIFNLFLCSL